MKKILTILVSLAMLTSCSFKIPDSIKYKDYKPVRDHNKQMELLRENFPEIYNLYREGEVVLDDIFEYSDRDGTPKVHISYHYRYRGRR